MGSKGDLTGADHEKVGTKKERWGKGGTKNRIPPMGPMTAKRRSPETGE